MHKRAVNKSAVGSHDEGTGLASKTPTHAALAGIALGGIACLLWLGTRPPAAPAPATAAEATMQDVADYALGPDEASTVVAKINSLGLSLLSSLYSSGGNSILFSPLSIVSALGMVSLGTTPGGSAEKELQGAWQLEERQAIAFLADLRQQLAESASSSEKVDFVSANSVWCKSSIKDSYARVVQKQLLADARPLPAEPEPINSWIADATKGMVPSILDHIDKLTVAILVNAVFFKGIWTDKFLHVSRGTYTSAHLGARPCAMMRREDENMLYLERHGMQVVELAYGSENGRFAAVVMLPPTKGGIEEEEQELAEMVRKLGGSDGADSLMQDLEDLRPAPVELHLPRFGLEFSTDLTPDLQESFGIRQAFDGRSQFLRMSDDPDVHLSAVFHKAKVEVNEEGTKAAAASAAVMNTRSMKMPPPNQARVIVNRPFLFLIRDKVTGVLLFVGAVEDPILDIAGV